MGSIEMHKKHVLTLSGGPFQSSPYLQELMCYVGTELVFENASAMLTKTKGIEINAKQIERVCHHYGERIEEIQAQSIASGAAPANFKADFQNSYYAMLDGAMLLTREEKWKELKLGRIFKGSDIININKNRNQITDSLYVAHLGTHTDFLQKFEHYLDQLRLLIFIADGAPWIWKWIEANYPESIQILDFFHAKEHLYGFAKIYFSDLTEYTLWAKTQSDLLLNDQIKQVIENIEQLPKTRKPETEQSRKALINYYNTNNKRMMYKTFREQGLLIGSGPIESAHRNVIQQRLKLSGQRWTQKGLQQMANLRVVYKSNKWVEIVDYINKAA